MTIQYIVLFSHLIVQLPAERETQGMRGKACKMVDAGRGEGGKGLPSVELSQ